MLSAGRRLTVETANWFRRRSANTWQRTTAGCDGRSSGTRHWSAAARATGQPPAWAHQVRWSSLEAVAGDRLEALWRLAVTTGARRGELLGATWLGFSEKGTLEIAQQVLPTRGGPTSRHASAHSRRARTIVSARLGHSSPMITLSVYAHVLPKSDDQAAEVMAAVLG